MKKFSSANPPTRASKRRRTTQCPRIPVRVPCGDLLGLCECAMVAPQRLRLARAGGLRRWRSPTTTTATAWRLRRRLMRDLKGLPGSDHRASAALLSVAAAGPRGRYVAAAARGEPEYRSGLVGLCASSRGNPLQLGICGVECDLSAAGCWLFLRPRFWGACWLIFCYAARCCSRLKRRRRAIRWSAFPCCSRWEGLRSRGSSDCALLAGLELEGVPGTD